MGSTSKKENRRREGRVVLPKKHERTVIFSILWQKQARYERGILLPKISYLACLFLKCVLISLHYISAVNQCFNFCPSEQHSNCAFAKGSFLIRLIGEANAARG